MSLADELLADLEDDNDEEMEEGVDTIKEEPKAPAGDGDEEDADSGGEEDAVIYDLKDEPMEINLAVASIREICKLRDSDRLSNVLSQIEKYAKNPRTTTEMVGNVESDPEYQLIVEANNIAVDIDNEICTYCFAVVWEGNVTTFLFESLQPRSISSSRTNIRNAFPSWIHSSWRKWTTFAVCASWAMI